MLLFDCVAGFCADWFLDKYPPCPLRHRTKAGAKGGIP
jgi:hypothetical protein